MTVGIPEIRCTTTLKNVTQEELEWMQQLINDPLDVNLLTITQLHNEVHVPIFIQSFFKETTTDYQWPCFYINKHSPGKICDTVNLSITIQENLNGVEVEKETQDVVNQLALFIQLYIKKCKPELIHTFEWLRLNSGLYYKGGGGACIVTKKYIKLMHTSAWLRQQVYIAKKCL